MTPLRQRMLEDMQVRNLSPHTQRAYIGNVARFSRHFGRSPAELGPEEIRTYQVYLVRERTLAPSSVEIAVCALRFLYKVTLKKPWSFDDLIPAPKKPRRLRVVLSPDEVVRAGVRHVPQAPRRPDDVLRRRTPDLGSGPAPPRDVDSQRMVIRSRTPVLLRFRVELPSVTATGRWRERGRMGRRREFDLSSRRCGLREREAASL